MTQTKSKVLVLGIVSLFVSSCGKDNNSNAPQLTQGDPAKANFAWVQANVLQPSCVGCHSPHPATATEPAKKAAAGIDLSTYELMMPTKVVIAGKPEASTLYGTIASGRMPKEAAALSPEQAQAVWDWIKNGASK